MIDQFYSYHVLVFKEDRVLLVKHGEKASHFADVYGIPGGRSIDNESEKETAIRELKEETGLAVREMDLKDFTGNIYSAYIKRKKGPSGNFTMKVFTTELFAGELVGTDEADPQWIKLSELDNYNLLLNVKKAVLAAKRTFTKP